MASKELLKMIDEWADDFTKYLKTKPLVEKIQEKAAAENIDNDGLRKLIESALTKRGLSDRTVRRNLPDELKQTYSERKPKLDTMSNVEKPTSKTVEIKQNVEAQDVEIAGVYDLREGENVIASAAKQIAASIEPPLPEESDRTEPEQPETPFDDEPTEEPDDGTEYHGDAGNNPELIKEYVDPKPIKLKVRMNKKYIGTIFAINQNFPKVQDYDIELTIEGDKVTEVSARPIMRAIVK